VTDELLLLALQRARDANAVRPGPRYLAPIVERLLNPPPKPKRDDWHRTERGIDRKAAELGMTARPGEGYDSFKARIWDAIAARRRDGRGKEEGSKPKRTGPLCDL
jgi:hypothetical protein